MNFLNSINFFGGLSSAIQAALLLIIGLIAAAIARAVVKGILIRVMNRREQKQLAESSSAEGENSSGDEDNVKKGILSGLSENKAQVAAIIGNLVFAIVFLLFLPGALDKLGVDSVASPISGMARKFVEFIPRIVAAIIIVVFGYFLSKLVRDILKIILQKTKIDSLQSKIGVKSGKSTSFSAIIANIVFALLMIVFVIAALQALQLHSISDPASEMLSTVFTYLPLLFAALIVIVIGIFIANIVAGLLENVIAGTGFDDRIGEIMPKNKEGKPAIAFSRLLGIIVRVVIIIFFVVAGLRIMNIEVLTKIGTTIIAYMPNVLAAVIVFIIAWFVADKISKLILKASPDSEGLAKGVKIVIYVIAAFMILSQLHIASNIVHILFTALVIGLAAAFAIAFGVGGRHWAAKKLENIDKSIEKEKARREEAKAMQATEKSSSSRSSDSDSGSGLGSFFGFGKKNKDKKSSSGSSYSSDRPKYDSSSKAESAAADAVSDANVNAGSAAGAAKDAAGDAADKVKDAADGAVDKAKDVAGEAADKAKEVAGDAADKAKDAAGDKGFSRKNKKSSGSSGDDSPYYYKNKKDKK